MDSTASGSTSDQVTIQEDEHEVKIHNPNLVSEKISNIYSKGVMTDVCLSVEGKDYPALRVVLGASSEVFQVMLTNSQWEECRQNKVYLQEHPACSKVFGQFVHYLHTGYIQINPSSAMPFLMLADKYMVKDLTGICIQYMICHIQQAAMKCQISNWLHYAMTTGHLELAESCENFVKWNLMLIASLPDFANFDIAVIERILNQSDLVVRNELALFDILVEWLIAQRRMLREKPGVDVDAEMKVIIDRTMKHIRFPMMNTRQLSTVLLSPIKLVFQSFINRIAGIMAYNTGRFNDMVQDMLQMDGGLGRIQFTPRLYTDEMFCSELTVENYYSYKSYLTHSLVFSSPITFAEYDGEKTCDWIIDLYPKGVRFPKCLLINFSGTLEVPERILRIVRVKVTCRDSPPDGVKVKVGLLTIGEQDGVKYVMGVTQCVHRFVQGDNVLNLDGTLSFDDLNPSSNGGRVKPSPYLIGPNKDVLKLVFVIVPLSGLSVQDVVTVPMSVCIQHCK